MACPQQILRSPPWGVWLDRCRRIFHFSDTCEGKRELRKGENKLEATYLWSGKQTRRNKVFALPHPLLTCTELVTPRRRPQHFLCGWISRDISRSTHTRAIHKRKHRHSHGLANAKASFSVGYDKQAWLEVGCFPGTARKEMQVAAWTGQEGWSFWWLVGHGNSLGCVQRETRQVSQCSHCEIRLLNASE